MTRGLLSKEQRHFYKYGTKIDGSEPGDQVMAMIRSRVAQKVYEVANDIEVLQEQAFDPKMDERWYVELREVLMASLGIDSVVKESTEEIEELEEVVEV